MNLRILASLLLLTACGGPVNPEFGANQVKGVPNGTWLRQGSERHALAGAWRSGCIASGSASTQLEARVFDDRTLILNFAFTDRKCKVRHFEQVFSIRGTPTEITKGEWQIEAGKDDLLDVVLIASTERAVRTMEKTWSCGKSGWKLNQAQSIYGSACFARGTSIGTYLFHQADDPTMLRIRVPQSDQATWLISRF